MSYKATNWAYEMNIRGSAKPVLVALADMADENATCYPSQDRIAAMTGKSASTVRRALGRLEEVGLIVRESRRGRLGYRASDRYRLLLDVTGPAPAPTEIPTGQNANQAKCLPGTVTVPTGQNDRYIEEEPSLNHHSLFPIPESGPAADVQLLDDLWKLWPSRKRSTRKRSGAAVRTALKAVGGVRYAHVILDAAKKHATVWMTWPQAERKFIPELPTWLNQERWTGVVPEPRDQKRPDSRIPAGVRRDDEWMYQ